MLHMFRSELQSLDDTGDLQLAQLLGYAGEQLADVHRVQPFGFASNPPAGSHGIGLALRGTRDLAVTLGLEYPPVRQKNLAQGASVLYDQWGNVVSLTQAVKTIRHSTKIVLQVGSTIVSITSGRINLGADPAPNAVMTTAGASSVVFAV